MVERILLFKLLESSERDEVAETLKRELAHLSGLTQVSVGVPADEASAKSWDVSCVLRFESLRALDAALASEAFKACVHGTVQARSAVIKAWSFVHA
jgi:hypothetical protein